MCDSVTVGSRSRSLCWRRRRRWWRRRWWWRYCRIEGADAGGVWIGGGNDACRWLNLCSLGGIHGFSSQLVHLLCLLTNRLCVCARRVAQVVWVCLRLVNSLESVPAPHLVKIKHTGFYFTFNFHFFSYELRVDHPRLYRSEKER